MLMNRIYIQLETGRNTLRSAMVIASVIVSGAASAEVVVSGSVYGGGNEADVKGNTEVGIETGKVLGSVYGGGNLGSVGTFTVDNVADNGVADGKPVSCAVGTGICNVAISGNAEIGPASPMRMTAEGKPDDLGHVFGAGKGTVDMVSYPLCETMAYVDSTKVTITGDVLVKGSVYGGSESGHVLHNAGVSIEGGQIGCVKDKADRLDNEVWEDSYTSSETLDCASWPFGEDTDEDGKKDLFAPYDPFAGEDGKYSNGKSAEGGRKSASDGHTFYGNVYGGGSGCIPYFNTTDGISEYLSHAGTVEGNTWVVIGGGHVLTNVYGGCETTNVLGTANVSMSGGTIGVPRTDAQIEEHPVTGYLFGAGKGDQRIYFTKETNVRDAVVTVSGGRIYGSVYGGGEDGHVLRNVTVTIKEDDTANPPIIGTNGTSYFDGHVFGGGRGFGGEALTAGNVGGSVEVTIEGGKILGSVYGGGRMASVGYGLYLSTEEGYGELKPDNEYDGSYPNPSTEDASVFFTKGRGYITINISGGTIGNDNEYKYPTEAEKTGALKNTSFNYQDRLLYTKGGNVFTGGMGRLYALDGSTLLPLWPKLGKCKQTVLNVTGGTIKSSVYGGGELGTVGQNATVNITGGTVGTEVAAGGDNKPAYKFGSVFGGGKGSTDDITTKYPSSTTDEDKISISEAGTIYGDVVVNLNGLDSDEYVTLHGGAGSEDARLQTKSSDGTYTLKGTVHGGIVNQVFGCNDMNGSPKGPVTVHVYATQGNGDNIAGKTKNTYDIEAVYGGGNLAAYIPTDALSTDESTRNGATPHVIIDGCGLTSIKQVYGGGNAAPTPATDVTVNGTYEIFELFGGGNGADKLPDGSANPGANVGFYDYSSVETQYSTKEDRQKSEFTSKYTYGTGKASVNIFGGTVHRVFGGSNTKGNVRHTAVTLLDEKSDCQFVVDEAYGGGKSAEMDAEAQLLMACIPGLTAAYGGAEAADVHGNVTLNITNGTFDRIFGGNNLSGTINGSISVNVEEVGCRPVKIGELYGGGNQAAYSVYGYNDDGTANQSGAKLYEDPQVNVMSFTSIGNIYGGGYGEGATMIGNPTVNVNVAYGRYYNDMVSVVGENTETPNNYPIPSHAMGKMGAINNVFGGGNAARVIGNTTVNIATDEEVYVVKQITTGASVTDYYTRSGAGTTADPFVYSAATGTAVDGTTYYEKKTVQGVDIRGNVYGGGNQATVTGNAEVNIGKRAEE